MKARDRAREYVREPPAYLHVNCTMETVRFTLLAAVLVALAGSAAAKAKDTTVTNKVRVFDPVVCTLAARRTTAICYATSLI